jgi:hypothetical protein
LFDFSRIILVNFWAIFCFNKLQFYFDSRVLEK